MISHIKKLILFVLFLSLAAGPAAGNEKRVSVPLGDSPSYGPQNAAVTIIEFIDFQ